MDLAKPYVEGLEKKVAELKGEKANWEDAERLRKQQAQPMAVRALEGKLKDLEVVAEKTKAALGESEKVIESLKGQ